MKTNDILKLLITSHCSLTRDEITVDSLLLEDLLISPYNFTNLLQDIEQHLDISISTEEECLLDTYGNLLNLIITKLYEKD
jgi:acyl carrier protein